MSRLTDAIIKGAYNREGFGSVQLDLAHGGQQGWSPNLTEWVSNQAHVSRPTVCILLEAPRLFTEMPDSSKWVSSLKSLFELHAKTIDGMNATLTVDVDEHPVGGSKEVQQEFTNVTRERSAPKFTFTEKYGRPIQTLLDYWIRYGMMDPETKFALLGTMGKTNVKDLLADWYSATCLFFEPDYLHKTVNKAWMTTNMFPMGTGEIVSKRDLTTGQEILTLDIEFTGLSQFGLGVTKFAQGILDNINSQNADPFMKSSFLDKMAADVEAANTTGYKNWTETVGKQTVTNMSK